MKNFLGIEFGSTRIKCVLIDERGTVLATGVSEWENEFVNGHWSYSLQMVNKGLKKSYKSLKNSLGRDIENLDGIGVSAMMHGYLAFDEKWNLLENFRTWRDTTTAEAAEMLTEKFKFNMPQRWSATHYLQALLNGEKTAKKVAHLTTLAGYVHFLLTGENVLGANDASGMFPLNAGDYDSVKSSIYEGELKKFGVNKKVKELFPKVLLAGASAGRLTRDGAKYIDEDGTLRFGVPLCPPEGDMGTGMVCTNSLSPATAQASCGTSANMSVVLEKPLKNYYRQVDIVATPEGLPAALIHTNNCTTEINEWVELFKEVLALGGVEADGGELIKMLFEISLYSDEDTGGVTGYNFTAGEPLAKTEKGAPVIFRGCEGKFNLANFMQMQIYSAVSALTLGVEILKDEGVKISEICAHGGFYKTEKIGQAATAAALGAPVTVMKNAGEGGAFGIALLALYSNCPHGTLREFLNGIFFSAEKTTLTASEAEKKKYKKFYDRYKKYLAVARAASEE